MIETADVTLLTGGTYTAQNMTAILPTTDVAQCLSFVNEYLLIGGKFNIIYPWDLNPEDNTWSNPLILLPETNISNIVTVGNNAYIFAGNRGNIYITNGSQASLFKKLPDHLSGGVEPLYAWGGATYNKNRLYFGVNVTLTGGRKRKLWGYMVPRCYYGCLVELQRTFLRKLRRICKRARCFIISSYLWTAYRVWTSRRMDR